MPQSIGVVVQDDAHDPLPWRSLTADEQASFDLGYAVFNTQWSPADAPAGRTDGLGPVFNAQSCDACHNSRRRGRGPGGEGEAPADLVIQLGQRLPDGNIRRGIDEYGQVLNTSAVDGFTREASVSIRYEERLRTLGDGAQVSLRAPRYQVAELSGPALPADTVLMPRMPPSLHGAGLLERVPESELTRPPNHNAPSISGRISRLEGSDGQLIGRYGWQATEPSIAVQTATAFSREMALTTRLVPYIDCGHADQACQSGSTGGTPEVEPALFDALVFFQRLHAVPAERAAGVSALGEKLFVQAGCNDCHRSTLRVQTGTRARQMIHPYTDLLLHDMGTDLADRDVDGNAIQSEWRTAPLWGMQAAVASTQPLRLLHDGRARSIEEAILWHDGEAKESRERFMRLPAEERHALESWIATR